MILHREVKNRKLQPKQVNIFQNVRIIYLFCFCDVPAGISNGTKFRTYLSTEPAPYTYPADPADSYYQEFQTVPASNVTADRFMTNFLAVGYWLGRYIRVNVDTVVVIDGSGSIDRCEFEKGKEALTRLMGELITFDTDTKYAAVTFSDSARVNFKFLPHSSAASEIMKIPYPDGGTNTQAGLAEAERLFNDSSSGRRDYARRTILLITDGHSNVQSQLTIPNANALKDGGVQISVVAVGTNINGINEIVKVASYPPDRHIFRVKTLGEFNYIVQLILQNIYPFKWTITADQYDIPCF